MNNVGLINNRTYWFDDLLFLIRSNSNIFMTPTGSEIDVAFYTTSTVKFTILQSSKGVLVLRRITSCPGSNIHKIISIIKDVDINVCFNEYETSVVDCWVDLVSAKRLLNKDIDEFINGHKIPILDAMDYAQPYKPAHRYDLETFTPENVIHGSIKIQNGFWSKNYGM